VPEARQYDRAEAMELLAISARVGELTPDGVQQQRERGSSTVTLPENLKEMPLLRLVPDGNTRVNGGSPPHVGTQPHALQQDDHSTVRGRFERGQSEPNESATLRPLRRFKGTPLPEDMTVPKRLDGEYAGNDRERPQADSNDERTRITGTTVYPWNVVGQLQITFSQDAQGTCTGTLVSPYVVITAGHCIHSRDRGGFPSVVRFAPGQSQASLLGAVTQPFGIRNASNVITNSRWTQISGGEKITTSAIPYDYAAVYFSTPFTFTSAFMPIVYDDTGTPVNNAGFPGTIQGLPNSGMWFDSGDENTTSTLLYRPLQFREFDIDVSGGHSGGPYWVLDGTVRSLTGIVSYTSGRYSDGAWIGGANRSLISTWAAYTPPSGGGGSSNPNARVGLRAPYILATGDPLGSSFLRLANSDLRSGTMQVALANGTTGQIIGRWTSPSLPPGSARQFDMRTIEMQAVPAIDPALHSDYSISVTSTVKGYLQHIVFNPGAKALTNVTGCERGTSINNAQLMNVHTSRLAAYPSFILFHNTGTTAAEPTFRVYDAVTGSLIGSVKSELIQPDSSGLYAMASIETTLRFVPSETQLHVNVTLGDAFQGYVQHYVENTDAQFVTNMTTKCDLIP
jgi:V8-like Glu-specific endopeptidase